MATKKKNPSKEIELSIREAPEERKQAITDFLMPLFNDAQMRLLVNKTPAYAIMKRQGAGGQMLSYVKHGYVTDQLNKAFGFDWDLIIDPMANGQMYALEIESIPRIDGKTNKALSPIETRHIAVCGHLVVRVHDAKGNVKGTITKSGFGSQTWNAKMELGDALKAAKSDLLKVCAAQVGVALDLYWNDMDEVQKYEDEQEKKRQRNEQQAIIDASFTEDDSPANPTSGIELITRALSELGLNGQAVAEMLGKKDVAEVIKSFSDKDWEILKNANTTK